MYNYLSSRHIDASIIRFDFKKQITLAKQRIKNLQQNLVEATLK